MIVRYSGASVIIAENISRHDALMPGENQFARDRSMEPMATLYGIADESEGLKLQITGLPSQA